MSEVTTSAQEEKQLAIRIVQKIAMDVRRRAFRPHLAKIAIDRRLFGHEAFGYVRVSIGDFGQLRYKDVDNSFETFVDLETMDLRTLLQLANELM